MNSWGDNFLRLRAKGLDPSDAAYRADQIEKRNDTDPKRAAYLQKKCTCGSGLADGLCVNCWPQ